MMYHFCAASFRGSQSREDQIKTIWAPGMGQVSVPRNQVVLISRSENSDLLWNVMDNYLQPLYPECSRQLGFEEREFRFCVFPWTVMFYPDDAKLFEPQIRLWDEYPSLTEIEAVIRDFLWSKA